jgi:hypothetical protein
MVEIEKIGLFDMDHNLEELLSFLILNLIMTYNISFYISSAEL